jgi:biopolymer transport protein ExbB
MIALIKAFAFAGGEWVIYLLIACSMLAVAVMIERGVVMAREKKILLLVKGIFGKGLTDASKAELGSMDGLSSKVVFTAASHLSNGPGSMEEFATAATNEERRRLETRMIILGTLGNNAIYIGLFGTVLGVIRAFHDLAMQSDAGPEVVMSGLSEALVATAVGLLVALPCVIAYNIFQKRINDLVSETEGMVRMLLAGAKSKQ